MNTFLTLYRTITPKHIRNKMRYHRMVSASRKKKKEQLQTAFELYKSKGLIFFHIPKSAGVSIFQAIYGEDSWGHAALSDFVEFIGKDEVYSLPRACVVRNPYLRLYSAYKYLYQGGRGKGLDFRRQEILKPYDTFEKFVKVYLSSGDAFQIIHFKTQSYWVTDKNGQLGVDYVGYYENIEESFKKIVELSSITAGPLQKVNKGPRLTCNDKEDCRIEDIFDREMISITNRLYEDDFRIFNYRLIDV